MFTVSGMLKFHEWAHSSLTATFDHCETLTAEELKRHLDGFGFDSIWDQLGHIVGCEDHWIGWLTQTGSVGEKSVEVSIAALRERRHLVATRTREVITALGDKGLDEVVDLLHDDGSMSKGMRAMFVHQLLTHLYHHKGQVAAMCRLLDKPMPDTDLFRD